MKRSIFLCWFLFIFSVLLIGNILFFTGNLPSSLKIPSNQKEVHNGRDVSMGVRNSDSQSNRNDVTDFSESHNEIALITRPHNEPHQSSYDRLHYGRESNTDELKSNMRLEKRDAGSHLLNHNEFVHTEGDVLAMKTSQIQTHKSANNIEEDLKGVASVASKSADKKAHKDAANYDEEVNEKGNEEVTKENHVGPIDMDGIKVRDNIGFSFNVATINVFNTNASWKDRFKQIAKYIRKYEVDIIGVQEVRQSHAFGNQIDHLLRYIDEEMATPAPISHDIPVPSSYYYVYNKSMDVRNPSDTQGYEEGLAILSRFKIIDHDALLQKGGAENWNDRLVLRAKVQLFAKGIPLQVFVTHQAIDPVDQCKKISELSFYANTAEKYPQILMGDFNTYFDFPYPMQFLTEGNVDFLRDKFQNKNCNQKCQESKFTQCKQKIEQLTVENSSGHKMSNWRGVHFKDVWRVLKPSKQGYTFTNYGDQDMCRADRILYRNRASESKKSFNPESKDLMHFCIVPTDIKVVGDKPFTVEDPMTHKREKIYISDHRMVITTFFLQACPK